MIHIHTYIIQSSKKIHDETKYFVLVVEGYSQILFKIRGCNTLLYVMLMHFNAQRESFASKGLILPCQR